MVYAIAFMIFFFGGTTLATQLLAPQSPGLALVGMGELVVWGYALYWAFDIRRALSSPVFRNQALGMGLLAAGWAAFLALGTFFIGSNGFNSGLPGVAGFLSFVSAIVLTYYWFDASIIAAQRTDPFLRDTLRWRMARYPAWMLLILFLSLIAAGTYSQQVAAFAFSPILSGVLLVLLVVVVLGLPGVTFAISVRNSRNPTLRRHLTWSGLGIGGFLAMFSVGDQILGFSAITLGYMVFGYCLYRSAKSLAPMERMSKGQAPNASEGGIQAQVRQRLSK